MGQGHSQFTFFSLGASVISLGCHLVYVDDLRTQDTDEYNGCFVLTTLVDTIPSLTLLCVEISWNFVANASQYFKCFLCWMLLGKAQEDLKERKEKES